MAPLVFKTPSEVRQWRESLSSNVNVGFVPTMGALHAGHVELLKKSHAENDVTVLSVFVNPTQFNNPDDLQKYPVTWEADIALAESKEVDAIFCPEFSSIYPDNYKYKIVENNLSTKFCGAHRPGHFDGVLSVVMKLLNIVSPNRAYFGEKDFQQLTLIKGMVETFFINCEIVPVPTVREVDGLAMSSRNIRLTAEQREKAPLIFKAISRSSSANEAAELLTKNGFIVDYVEDYNGRRFAAANLGGVRLIDNVEI